MPYPISDKEFYDERIKSVSVAGKGWGITQENGWSFYVPGDSPVEPEPGMTVRFYGRGIGATVRGLFIDGTEVFYRTAEEEKDHSQKMMYGESAQEWLRRWDAGKSVWSISMGGFGPGYEQALQIAAAEILRFLLREAPDGSELERESLWKRLESETLPILDSLGLSGAQWGAAKWLGCRLYIDGPIKLMTGDEYGVRHIQVSRNFPRLETEAK